MGSGSASTAFGKGKSSSSTSTRIPAYLRPFIEQSTDLAGDTLGRLNSQLGRATGEDLVAGFTPAQELAQLLGIDRAMGGGDFFPTAQNTLLEAARGVGVDEFVPGEAFGSLSRSAGGEGLDSFLDPAALERLRSGASGDPFLESLLGGSVPSSSTDALTGILGRGARGTDELSSLLSSRGAPESAIDRLRAGADSGALPGSEALSGLTGSAVPGTTRATLEETARGDFLFGGQGFDQAVDAAIRAATPGVISAFGRGGANRARGGLAETAIAQSGIDAFARQFGDERGRQLSAAGALGDLDLRDVGQRADIASVMADLGLSQRGQELGAAGALADLGLSERGQSADIAGLLGELGLAEGGQDINAAGLLAELGLADTGQQADIAGLMSELGIGSAGALADLGSSERGRSLASSGLLAELGLTERGNQLDAARDLPGIAESDIGLLDRIGATQQEIEQLRRMAPIDAQLQLLSAALGGLPIESLLGSKTRNRFWQKEDTMSASGGFGGI